MTNPTMYHSKKQRVAGCKWGTFPEIREEFLYWNKNSVVWLLGENYFVVYVS